MKVNGQLVLMRKEDGFLNATQIITLAKKNNSERKYILGRRNQNTKVEVLPATKGIPYPHSWIKLPIWTNPLQVSRIGAEVTAAARLRTWGT